ncbi:unnamed protein product [Amoebophrya sp. A25]|nr:unnamed protein product [Amoebophrya sp. A25]|eukprot:GSA25T00018021001.1
MGCTCWRGSLSRILDHASPFHEPREVGSKTAASTSSTNHGVMLPGSILAGMGSSQGSLWASYAWG